MELPPFDRGEGPSCGCDDEGRGILGEPESAAPPNERTPTSSRYFFLILLLGGCFGILNFCLP